MRKLLAAAAGCAIIACMLYALFGQDKPYKDIMGDSFRVIAQIDCVRQLENVFEAGYEPDASESVNGSIMLTFAFTSFEEAERVYLALEKYSDLVYLEGGMQLSVEQAEQFLAGADFVQSGDIFFCREDVQSILRRNSSGYYLTTGYPYIISGC